MNTFIRQKAEETDRQADKKQTNNSNFDLILHHLGDTAIFMPKITTKLTFKILKFNFKPLIKVKR